MTTRMLTWLEAALMLAALVWANPIAAQATDSPLAVWAQGTVNVTGMAVTGDDPSVGMGERRLSAVREAKLDAVKRLTEQVYATTTASGATVGELIAADETHRGPVDALVQGARITATRFLPEGRVEVDMEIGLEALPAILGL